MAGLASWPGPALPRPLSLSAADAARRYLHGGLSVIPVRTDGSKAPALAWKAYQRERATPGEVASWYAGEAAGVAILGGVASGGLEVLDFDAPEAWERWRVVALTLLDDEGERLPRLPLVRTPSDGRHLYFRHMGSQEPNQKLARGRRTCGEIITLIETRGCNGYVLAPGCPAACHPAGKTYDLLQGDLAAVPTISQTQRAILLDAARTLSEVTAPEQVVDRTPRVSDGTRPGDVYNACGAWESLLRAHGWRRVGQHDGTGLWRRPGKSTGISATTNYGGSGYLYVWSTNARPFEAERAYSPFSAYALLEHHGDWAAAATALHAAGYVAPSSSAAGLATRCSTGRQATDRLIGKGAP